MVDATGLLDVFDEVVSAVRAALDGVADRRRRGGRSGQYALDLVADEVALTVLHAAGLRVLSEESGLTGPPDAAVWVALDPVDGSTNASRGIPFFATSLCAVDGDGMLAATVANLATGTTYRAIRGGGATRDGQAISVGAPTKIDDAMIGVNGYPSAHMGWRQYRSLGSAALEICAVADGSLDGYVNVDRDGHGPWDYLGGALLVAEAGGVAIDVDHRDLVTLGHDDRRTVAAASDASLAHELAGWT